MNPLRSSTPGFLLAGLLAALLLTTAFAAPATAYTYAPPWGTGQSQGEDLVIKLVTFSPGDEIASWFGHSALVVEDQRFGHSRLYNYGMFSFDRDMLIRFGMGRLWFWVGEASVFGSYELYRRADRDVRIQELNIRPEKRLEVAAFLANNVLPENRDYLYHHYDDNCSTRIRDVVDLAVDGQLKEAMNVPARMTLRDHTRRHSAHNAYMDALLMFWMNDSIDEPILVWDEMFLPGELERVVDDFVYTDPDGKKVPLVTNRTTHHESTRTPVPENAPTHWPFALGLGLLLGVGALGLGRWEHSASRRAPRVLYGLYHSAIGLAVGVPGLILGLFWAFTEHEVTHWNQNILLANPLTFLAFPLGLLYVFGSARVRRVLSAIWLFLAVTAVIALLIFLVGLIFPSLHQGVAIPLAFLLPMNLGFGAASYLYGPLFSRAPEEPAQPEPEPEPEPEAT